MRIRARRVALSAVVASASVAAIMAVEPQDAGAESASAPTGTWVMYAATPAASNVVQPNSLPGGDGGGCPSGTTSYGGSNAKWDCLDVTPDGSGHNVWIRNGQSGSSGFGYLHAYIDHNVDLLTLYDVVSYSAGGIKQSPSRYLYGGEYHVNGEPIEYLNLIEQRTEGSGSPDGHELGVVTAYCTGTYDGAEPKTKCPDWVNETIHSEY